MKKSTVATAAIATVTATGTQTAVAVGTENSASVNIVASSVTTGASFQIEGRTSTRDGAGSWIPVVAFDITANGTYSIPVFGSKQRHIRTGKTIEEFRLNCTALTDGSYVATSGKVTH
jgi:hypothetical protein